MFLPGAAVAGNARRLMMVLRAKSVFYDIIFKEVNELFKVAINNAKMTGKMLGVALALGYPFSTQTVSMIGFSLGTQVIKSCLKTLHKIGAHDIVHNVTLLGGATHFETNHSYWEEVFTNTVAGKIKNAYSSRDFILGLYYISEKHDSIGRHQVLTKSIANLQADVDTKMVPRAIQVQAVTEGSRFKLYNYPNKCGHMEYRDKLVEISNSLLFE